MLTTRLRVHAFLVAVIVLAGLSVAPATAGDRYWEVGIQGGFFLPDDDVSGKAQTFDEIEPTAGLRGGYLFADHWGWFLDGLLSDINANTSTNDVDSRTLRTGIDFFFRPHQQKRQWFLGFGGGLMDLELESGGSFDRTFASLSVGQRLALDRRARFRWELRGDHTLEDDGFGGEDITRAQALIALTWGIGIEDTDSDGDGVPDRRDDCPGTPRGAIVDDRGCPMDSDGDGIYDGIDQCPDTPRGAIVDDRGCPMDSDGDGVYDGIDQCPDTPRGAIVDDRGCPSDSDGDGVYDGIDQCPNTPRGTIVDARGCPLDSDGDGVYDGLDKCPGTPPGTMVNAEGCPRAAPLFEPEKKTLILEGVFFEFDKAVLTPGSRTTLDEVARSLRDWPEVRVEIGGHTDWIGSDSYNLDLSGRRAQSVREYLAGRGVAANRMSVRGYGEGRPVASNKTDAGRAKNRRVELTRLDQ